MSLIEGIDYYINPDGNFVFMEAYHLKRGYCCKNGCLHCPWKPLPSPEGETNKEE
ncbi:hypothetical protein BDD43_5012 [Mucilaginibacter gracilis]|uniref:Uncharacterized protein n=1 Tax=Mucilaginibacter gracilis TaxID=423350 RepID=A0A495J6Z3_9SPHI|nr:DUF5522 domain-containing protein [Mucilaginibacter gracilis]RKR84760.1 hypothetical protein BDD43_5012 [Mucilaginibacter gracilis]